MARYIWTGKKCLRRANSCFEIDFVPGILPQVRNLREGVYKGESDKCHCVGRQMSHHLIFL